MVWNKLKQQLESFLSPSLVGKVEYLPSGYRYLPDKPVHCYLTVNKIEIFNVSKSNTIICWYDTEQDVKRDTQLIVTISPAEIIQVKKELNENVPENRLESIAISRKLTSLSKQIYNAQGKLFKGDFQSTAVSFLSDSIENSLESDDILINVLAIIDRRVGKKRLISLKEKMQMKHPAVRYFYNLRINSN